MIKVVKDLSGRKKTVAHSVNDKKNCTKCLESKYTHKDFYKTFHPFYSDGRYSICKVCIKKYFIPDPNDIDQMINVLRMLDAPFNPVAYKKSQEEAERRNMDLFGVYMKNIAMNDYKEMNYSHSIFDEEEIMPEKYLANDFGQSIVSNELISYWGTGYTNKEYAFLENERFRLMSSFECPDYGMEMIMRDICFINLDIETLRGSDKSTRSSEISKLIKTRSDLMNDANIKPIQATGADANDQNTFGTLIKKWENDLPVPQVLDDEMKRYIDTFMVGHLAKMEGLNNDFTQMYDEEMKQYTIDFKELDRRRNMDDD